jgi:hypothetical protein
MDFGPAFSLRAAFVVKLCGHPSFQCTNPKFDHCDACEFDDCYRYDRTVHSDWELQRWLDEESDRLGRLAIPEHDFSDDHDGRDGDGKGRGN